MTTQREHKQFIANPRKHIYMLSTHGVHQWDVVPGLTDTGGQNIFVNQFAEELANHDFKITIFNRGGYSHPVEGTLQKGLHYQNENLRIAYLEDGTGTFVRKEDMGDQVHQLAAALTDFAQSEDQPIDLIISHYWDAAVVGALFLENRADQIPHIWVPHSLGKIKQGNVSRDRWRDLRIHERIENELQLVAGLEFAASTSPLISKALRQDYAFQGNLLWLPPCVAPTRFYPRELEVDADVWRLLAKASGLPVREVQKRKIITEISRTDTTKRKDILLKAYAKVREKHPDTLLVVSIDQSQGSLHTRLQALIDELHLRQNVAVMGSIWEALPEIYAASDLYCTPSIMEGFGMSAQEAAGTAVPIIASSLVPFAVQYLFWESEEPFNFEPEQRLAIGNGAIIVRPDDVEGFSEAMDLLISDEKLRRKMGEGAYKRTIPRFTWPHVVDGFLKELKVGR